MKVTIRTVVPPVGDIPDDAEIQDCDLAFECPKHWGNLTPTDNPKIRLCAVCSKSVYFCFTSDDLWDAQQAGQCVAFLAVHREVKRVLLGMPSTHRVKQYVEESDGEPSCGGF